MNSPDLDVVTLGMMMAEIAPPRAGARFTDAGPLTLFPSGSATIFGVALARLGARLGFISAVGDDELGAWLRTTLTDLGIDVTAVRTVPGQLTPVALASVDRDGAKQYAFYRFPGVCNPFDTLDVNEVSDAYLARGRVFDFTEGSIRGERVRATSLALARRARALGCTVCFNPNYRVDAWRGGAEEARPVLAEALAIATIGIMNGVEARLIAGVDSDLAAAEWLGDQLEIAVVTRGQHSTLLVTDGEITELPAFPVDVVFDIGAGDAFHAGFLAAWRPGADPAVCARFAAAASAVKIGRSPELVHAPTRAEVLAFLDQRGVDMSSLPLPAPDSSYGRG